MREFILNREFSGNCPFKFLREISLLEFRPISWPIVLPLKPMSFARVDHEREGAIYINNYIHLFLGLVLV